MWAAHLRMVSATPIGQNVIQTAERTSIFLPSTVKWQVDKLRTAGMLAIFYPSP